MSLLGMLKGAGPNGFGYSTTADLATAGIDLSGKTFLLTGGNSGLGAETLRVLAGQGAHVISAARNLEKAQAALDLVGAVGSAVACELSEPVSVRQCITTVAGMGRTLDGIICNAGIMALPKLTLRHGFELQFLTNHIGHFILVMGLLDRLAERGRVVIVSSSAHTAAPKDGIQFDNLDGKKSYAPWKNYGQSKLANILFAKQLAKRLPKKEQTANALHPGVITTNLGRHLSPVARVVFSMTSPLFLKSASQGASTQCYLAAHPDVASVSGAYFKDCNEVQPSAYARDEGLAERLWSKSEEIVAQLK